METKDKIAILSDIHANLEALNVVLDKMKELGVTHYVCLGDIVGYNANPKECLDIIRGLSPMLAVVRGNHDEYVGTNQDLLGFNPSAAEAVEWTRNQLTNDDKKWLSELPYVATVRRLGTGMPPFKIVHGTLDSPHLWGYIFTKLHAITSMENQKPEKVCFCGHSHMPIAVVENEGSYDMQYFTPENPVEILPNRKYLFNIGSVGQPRDNDPRASFALYTPAERTVQLYRLDYDIKTCQQKILDAGLPDRLASRLEIGR